MGGGLEQREREREVATKAGAEAEALAGAHQDELAQLRCELASLKDLVKAAVTREEQLKETVQRSDKTGAQRVEEATQAIAEAQRLSERLEAELAETTERLADARREQPSPNDNADPVDYTASQHARHASVATFWMDYELPGGDASGGQSHADPAASTDPPADVPQGRHDIVAPVPRAGTRRTGPARSSRRRPHPQRRVPGRRRPQHHDASSRLFTHPTIRPAQPRTIPPPAVIARSAATVAIS